MSRTYKTRPMWVQNNDPQRTPYRVRHDHRVTLSEVVGYEEYEPFWDKGTTRQRPLYRRWSEQIPCTADVLEQTTSSWRYRRPRVETNEDRVNDKHCDTQLLWYAANWNSKKDMKRLTNRAIRSKINQQMHNAVRDKGSWTSFPYWVYFEGWSSAETPWFELWEEVDINADTKYAKSYWWD